MYQLTLTREERKAIDWVGDCYGNGDELFALLWHQCKTTPEEVEWLDSCNITFSIPEGIAQLIAELGEQEDNLWPCFSPELAAKMQKFVDSIV